MFLPYKYIETMGMKDQKFKNCSRKKKNFYLFLCKEKQNKFLSYSVIYYCIY